ncbi:MAG: FAD-binding oxidoreductase [Gammaproteobacteria bacterium]|nr:FAD-binding oxidoreductase [Gammaproteobacteria bacterium]
MNLSIGDFSTDNRGWSELLSERSSASNFRGSVRVPWVIVGAGFTGLACARRLAELHPNDEIILVDARLVGQGASGRNSGFAVAVSHFPGKYIPEQKGNFARVNRINQAGVEILDREVKTLSIDCQWDDGGFHHAAADADSIYECDNFLEYLNAMEIAHTPLNKDEMDNRLGTALYKVGVHVHAGALVQPAALVRGLASKLPSNIELIEQRPVLKVEEGRSIKLSLSDGEIITDRLVLATNYEAGKLGFLSDA